MTYKSKLTRLLALCMLAGLYLTQTVAAQAPATHDEEIQKMVSEVSAENLRALVEKMVSFETRHSLSS
ncbi:MAG: peptidase M28, partial [Hymenobacteraceae bacterium]|nr:peptidase M28 [Hymenobacteraceae bacterium]MDX5480176.1 peptidase M28 [Hymenobacteraceae bacterium]